MTTGSPRHTWIDNVTAITAAKLNETEQDVADALATSTEAYTLAATATSSPYTNEQAQDAAAGLFTSGTHTGISFTYDDIGNKVNATVTSGSTYTDEQVRDVMGSALVAGSNVTITPNDGADTITIAAAGGGGSAVTIAPETYGAVGNGSTDDTTALQNALNAAVAPTVTGVGGVVQLGAKTYLTGPLTIPHSVTLQGVSRSASRLLLKTGSTAPCLTFGVHTSLATIRDLRVDGNKFNQTSTSAHGVSYPVEVAFDSGLDEYNDPRNTVLNVVIENCKGDGLRHESRGANQITNVWVWLCDGNGIYASGTDSYFTNIDVGGAGKDGFLVDGGDLAFLNCKAWYCGNVTTASGVGNGWHIQSYGGMKGAGLGAQDNARAGFFFDNCGRITLSSLIADSNNTANLGAPGIDLNLCYYSIISGYSWDRNVNTTRQAYALRVGGSSEGNRIELQSDQNGTGVLDPASSLPTNDVYVNQWLTPLRPVTSTTSARPSASAVGAGSMLYDTTLSKPVWSNGTVWKDATGTGGGGGTALTNVVDIQTQAGVTGDGVTDDSGAINTAITNAPVGTLFWFAPGKSYLINSTIVMKPHCVYASSGGSDGAMIVGSSTLTGAHLATAAWQNNTVTACDLPVQVRGLQIIGPGQTTGTAHGIVLINFWSRIENCFIGYVGGDGVRLTDVVRNGSPLTTEGQDCSENKVINCKISLTGGHGVFIQNQATYATNQDGHVVDCYIDNSGGSNIYAERGAGWFFSRNHLYDSMGDAMHIEAGFATHIIENYVEQYWGQQNAAFTDYAGIFLSQGPYFGSVIAGNFVAGIQGNDLTAANAWACYLIASNSAASATTPANVVFSGNSAMSGTSTTGANNKSLSVVFTGTETAAGELQIGSAGNVFTPGAWAATAPGWYSTYTLSTRGVARNTTGGYAVVSHDDVV